MEKALAAEEKKIEPAKPAFGGFNFGGAAKPAPTGGAFNFGGAAAAAPSKPASGGFSFGGDKKEPAVPASGGFSFNLGQKAPQSGFSFKPSAPAAPAVVAESNTEANEEPEQNENEPYFEPIVKLDEVEVKTGEEDDQVLFMSRAKLYRFVEGEWKERGLGDMKILKNQDKGRIFF